MSDVPACDDLTGHLLAPGSTLARSPTPHACFVDRSIPAWDQVGVMSSVAAHQASLSNWQPAVTPMYNSRDGAPCRLTASQNKPLLAYLRAGSAGSAKQFVRCGNRSHILLAVSAWFTGLHLRGSETHALHESCCMQMSAT